MQSVQLRWNYFAVFPFLHSVPLGTLPKGESPLRALLFALSAATAVIVWSLAPRTGLF
jgi:hypothetical protein